MKTDKPQTLARLRELLEKITPGPWTTRDEDPDWWVIADDEWNTPATYTGICSTTHDEPTHATFIAEARNALPGLLEVCEAARAVVESHLDKRNTNHALIPAPSACFACALAAALENLETGGAEHPNHPSPSTGGAA